MAGDVDGRLAFEAERDDLGDHAGGEGLVDGFAAGADLAGGQDWFVGRVGVAGAVGGEDDEGGGRFEVGFLGEPVGPVLEQADFGLELVAGGVD